MRYRQLTINDDYQFGVGVIFLQDSPAVVAQSVKTRLRLLKNEWFLDTTLGFDTSMILGVNTSNTRDLEVKRVILETQGVSSLLTYESNVDGRSFKVTASIDTIYGSVSIQETF